MVTEVGSGEFVEAAQEELEWMWTGMVGNGTVMQSMRSCTVIRMKALSTGCQLPLGY